jgi:heme-degrading monooxygenase HmoA
MLVIVWEFRVRSERIADFLAAYCPGGDWDRLFRRGEGYLSTELLRDQRDDSRFLTIDRWASREARDGFHLRFQQEYDALDRKCEELTLEETPIGDFSFSGPAR